MASFAQATKWLLAGHKVRRKCWAKGGYWHISASRLSDEDGDPAVLYGSQIAATDYVRLVPRKPKVDESLYEPVGTVPVVGDTFDLKTMRGTTRATVDGVDSLSVLHAKGAPICDLSCFTADGNPSGVTARILKRPERNVFTDPRVGDVVEYGTVSRTILAAHERGFLVDSKGVLLGYDHSEWADLPRFGYTVKHRAPDTGASHG